jgi:LCP family protein required for cell wall assembly
MAVESGVEPLSGPDRLTRRALLAVMFVVVLTGGATAVAGLLQFEGLKTLIPSKADLGIGVHVDPVDAGKPQTIMLLGTDGRLGADAGGGQRSDTILLARLDPDNGAITLTSIPRDLRVEIPGYGSDRINAAYSLGGTELTVKTVRQLLSTPGRPFKINHVLEVNFVGFRDIVDYFGCVYVDVDRDYFNNVGGPFGYAVIDIDPGYQKLCGDDALAYVRYRHTDSDLVRGARQQDFVRQALRQPQIQSKLTFSNHRELIRLAGKYMRMDHGLTRSTKQMLSLIKLGLAVYDKPVQQIPFAKGGLSYTMLGGASYLEATPGALAATTERFLHPQTEAAPAERAVRRAQRSPSVANYAAAGRAQAMAAGGGTGIPIYYPKLLREGSFYAEDAPRVYELHGKPAYRLSIQLDGKVGAFYGVQGMRWRDAPILAPPREQVTVDGRRLDIYGAGSKVTLVAWRTPRAVYYVHNTLTHDLSRNQMLAIARSLTVA